MTEFEANGLSSPNAEYGEFLNLNGYAVFTSVLTTEQCDRAISILDSLMEAQVSTDRISPHVDDPLNIRIWTLLSRTQKLDYLITSDFVDKLMREVFQRDTKHQLYYLSSFQGCILQPGAKRQKLHIDTPCPEPIPPYNLKANTIWCLDDFTEYNGATEVVPGSHRYPQKPSSSNLVESDIVKLVAPKGSVILTLGSLWHRGGENASKSPRHALFASFAASWIREAAIEEDICRRLEPKRILSANSVLIDRIGMRQGLP